jgi:hypothetical protein
VVGPTGVEATFDRLDDDGMLKELLVLCGIQAAHRKMLSSSKRVYNARDLGQGDLIHLRCACKFLLPHFLWF